MKTVQSNGPLVAARELSKAYKRGRESVPALAQVSFQIQSGEMAAVVGPSGSGKTTLLNLVGCMDAPTAGSLYLAGRDTARLSEFERTRMRREVIGFVFQHFGLIPTLTVAENIALPALFARRRATSLDGLLEKLGLSHRRDHRPHQLSGGEMQRVAIARALINKPRLLLADEPTGNLDTTTGAAILDLFKQLNAEGLTILLVTHNPVLAQAAERQLVLRDGRLVSATTRHENGAVPNQGTLRSAVSMSRGNV